MCLQAAVCFQFPNHHVEYSCRTLLNNGKVKTHLSAESDNPPINHVWGICWVNCSSHWHLLPFPLHPDAKPDEHYTSCSLIPCNWDLQEHARKHSTTGFTKESTWYFLAYQSEGWHTILLFINIYKYLSINIYKMCVTHTITCSIKQIKSCLQINAENFKGPC